MWHTSSTTVCQCRLLSVQDQNERRPQNLLTSRRRNGVHDTERCQSDALRVGRSPMMHAAVVGQHKLESGHQAAGDDSAVSSDSGGR